LPLCLPCLFLLSFQKKPLNTAKTISLLIPKGDRNGEIKDARQDINPISIRILIITEKRVMNPPMESSTLTEFLMASPSIVRGLILVCRYKSILFKSSPEIFVVFHLDFLIVSAIEAKKNSHGDACKDVTG